MTKEIVLKITVTVNNGTGFCTILSRDTKKKYQKNGPINSFLSDNQMASLLVSTVMKELFDAEIKEPDTFKPKQLTID